MMRGTNDCEMSSVVLECTQRPRPEWHVGRHGRKDVAERRGRKAWPESVVGRRG